jgi:predicted metal-dependent HD superfamily phosphohydrolase
MTDLPNVLLAAWDRLLPGQPDLGASLVAAYGDSSRHYHNLRHLQQVLTAVDVLAAEAADLDVVRLAAWFHDAVYDVRSTDNEEQSALLAESALTATEVDSTRVSEVVRLVRLTATHAPAPGDANGSVLCDADLSILATDPDVYAGYTRAVRVEYAHVPEDDFRRGRSAVLQQLLGLPSLFGTARGRREWEPVARANVSRELARLAT